MFEDRRDAGRRLAARLRRPLRVRGEGVVVLGLPRGGVPVAAEVARALGAPLDVVVVRKIGVPGHPEVALGALGEAGVRVVDDARVRQARVSPEHLAVLEARERAALGERCARLRDRRPALDLAGRTAVVVDDGIATGASLRVGCAAACARGAARVVAAAPVAPAGLTSVAVAADELVCVERPAHFRSVSQCYRDFRQVAEQEVVDLLG